MFIKILKFIGLIAIIVFLPIIPFFGEIISLGIIGVALWRLID